MKTIILYLQPKKKKQNLQNYTNLRVALTVPSYKFFYLQSKSLVQIWTWTLHLLQKQGTNKYFRFLK